MANKDIKKTKQNSNAKQDSSTQKHDGMFRQTALNKLSSPDSLDKLIKVTDPKGWLSLMGAIFIIIVTLMWGIFGKVPSKVVGNGILMKSGGIKSIQNPSSGHITDIRISEGDRIMKGDIIGRVSSTDILNNISNARFTLETLEENLERYISFYKKNSELKKAYFIKSEDTLLEAISDYDREVAAQKRKIEAQKSLLDKGGISREELRISEQELDKLESSKDSTENDLKQLNMDALSYEKEHQDSIVRMKSEIVDKSKEINYLREQLDTQSKIVSPHEGKVIEVLVGKGSIVSPGQNIARIEVTGKDVKNLECITFVPSIDGKQIKVGMDVQVSPSTVKAAEYGVMSGKVTKVSDYPVTLAYLTKVLGEDMANNFLMKMQDPIEIIVDLIPDAKSESGFKWSSIKGPPIKIRTGTPAEAKIIIKKQRPITFVFPILESKVGESR